MSRTIKDVAIHANVSPTTVSRVLNQKGYVSKEVKQRVLAAINELDYVPSLMAVSLSKNRMRTIGAIVPNICNSFFSEIFYGASKLAEKHNYRVILCNTDDNVKIEKSALQDMISYRVSGIIITPVSDSTNANILNNIQKMGIPVVFVDREIKGVDCDRVFVDNIRGSYDATALLLQEGHRKIAIIAGPQDTITGRERMIGYTNAMRDWGVEIEPEFLSYGDFKIDKSYYETLKLLKSKNPPTAFFTCNNLMTLGCLQAIQFCGKKIPDDVALIGFDEIDPLNFLEQKISVVSRAATEMGATAMRLLLERITQEELGSYQRVILQAHLKHIGR